MARLVPLDGEGRDRLVQPCRNWRRGDSRRHLSRHAGGRDVATRAWWVTRDGEPDSLIYGLTRALFNPANHAVLAASHPAAREISAGQRGAESARAVTSAAPRVFIAKPESFD